MDLVGRLAALSPVWKTAAAPEPTLPKGRYHGVLAAAHPWRGEIVPDPPKPRQRRSTWMPWAGLIRRVFDRDPLAWSPATPAACEQAMTPLALVRSGAHGVLSSGPGRLGRTGEIVLRPVWKTPPPRGDPEDTANGLA